MTGKKNKARRKKFLGSRLVMDATDGRIDEEITDEPPESSRVGK
jgi:hypothetical protein